MSNRDDDGIQDKSGTLEKAEKAMDRWGFPDHDRPTEDEDGVIPVWPNNVATLTLDEISHLLTWFVGWSAFGRENLGRAETNLSGFEEQLEHERTKFLFSSGIGKTGDYSTVTEAKAAFAQRPDTVARKQRVLEAKALVTMLRTKLEGFEEKKFVLSRELSKRGIDLRDNTRKHDGKPPKGERFS